MESSTFPAYTEDEKFEIAKRYLVARQLKANGLKPEQPNSPMTVCARFIRDYTREAGVRNLEREIGSVFRSAAMKIAEGTAEQVRIDAADLQEILGARRFEGEVAMRTSVPGVATGPRLDPGRRRHFVYRGERASPAEVA